MSFWFSKGTVMDEDLLMYVRAIADSGVRCFVATDQEKYRGMHLRETVGRGRFFEDVFFSAEIGGIKRSETYWDGVFIRINAGSNASKPVISREDTLFIDDDEAKIEAVSSFGINTLLYTGLDPLKTSLTESSVSQNMGL